jgi:hypothetical protein
MGAMRNTKFWKENLKERDNLEDIVADRKTILEYTLEQWYSTGGMRTPTS